MTETKTYTLRRDGARDLRFTGELIASASSWHHQGPRNTRWTELRLYLLDDGRHVLETVGRTLWEGETDRYRADVAGADPEAVIETVEHEDGRLGRLGRDLLLEAGIEPVETIQ